MTTERRDHEESDLPSELAKPAIRALTSAGYTRLEQLTEISRDEVEQLHGVGPKAIDQLRRALHSHGLSFADEESARTSP